MIRGRMRRHPSEPEQRGGDDRVVEIDPGQLSGLFSVPDWLRNIGLMSWLLVGVTLLLGGLVWLLALTQVITIPVIVAGIMAVVGSPVVGWMQRRHIPRGLGTSLLMLGIILVGLGVGLMVVLGIEGQAASIGSQLDEAKSSLGGWLQDLGLDAGKADQAKQNLGQGAADGTRALLDGLVSGAELLSGLAFFLAMTVLSLFFLLKDGPEIRAWTESHMGVPAPVARIVTRRTISSMRGYFLGTTIIAVFSAVVVGIGSVIIGVPLIGTIVAVTFIAGYIPYLGAWTAAAFTVLLALGSDGAAAAGGMVFVQLLANGPLQQAVQPFAMGTALGIHPLAVLIVTIAGGALFGTVGLIVSAPLVAAAVRISSDLAAAKAAERAEVEAGGESGGTDEVPPGAELPAPAPG